MLTWINAGILGAIEGLTEFLPVSSTAHLLIVSKVLGISESVNSKTFIIAVQLGAILAIIFYYRKELPQLIRLWKLVLLAFIPAALIGFFFYTIIKNVLFESFFVMATGLIVGGIIMIIVDKKIKHTTADVDPVLSLRAMKPVHAFVIGLFQALAVIPGVSRSAATIISGRFLGYSREAVTLFSFVLGSVTLGAAVAYDIYKSGTVFTIGTTPTLLIGFIIAFVAAYISIDFMIRLVKRVGFAPFGWYRIVVGILFAAFLLM